LPHQSHVYKITDESFRFHNKTFDEIRCKLDSTENPRSSEKYPTLRWGWVFLERTRILSGIQFTTHFIESFVVETKRFVGSTVNVILTRQTCGQRSSRDAESKRRALGNYFSERICYMFPISNCRGDRDLGLCPTSGLAFGKPLEKYPTPPVLYILMLGTYRKSTRKNNFLALGMGRWILVHVSQA